LSGVEKITGSLNCGGATNLTTLSAPSLSSIGKAFNLTDLTQLTTLSFPELTSVGSINWVTLPNLPTLSFGSVTQADSVLISDTTLTSLTGISLTSVDNVDINNNKYLKEIDMQLGNVTTSLNIAFNSQNINVTFPELIWAFNLTFRDCGLVSMPLLESVNGSMGFINNTFTEFVGPNVTSIGGSVSFVSNIDATNISLPLLTKIGGGFLIANNTKLTDIDGFKAVETVNGAVDWTGSFTKYVFPFLKAFEPSICILSSYYEKFGC
jgi:hypothetical protein